MPTTQIMGRGSIRFASNALCSPIAPDPATGRRAIGRLAGVIILGAGITAFTTMQFLSGRQVGLPSTIAILVSMATGVACLLVPWDALPPWALHGIPVIATVQVAVGIRLAGLYGDIAGNYYVFVAVFVAYAFSSRSAIVAHLGFAAAACSLPLFYAKTQVSHAAARTAVDVLMLVAIAGIVTYLREGLQARQQELGALALRDPLTNVGNYRLMSDRLEHELARHARSGEPLTVMLLDLDGFKEINDTFGHLVGDRVLIEVANALMACVRSQDTVARQGGDEFSILAPNTGDEQAQTLALRVQAAVGAAVNGAVTTSVGWATYPDQGANANELLALADHDLRRGKQGRERRARAGTGILHLVDGLSG